MKFIIAALFLITSTITLAQNKVSMAVSDISCNEITRQKMTFLSDGSLQNDAVVAAEMQKLKSCGLDDYDVQFFGRIDALSSLLKKMTKDKRLEFLTYGELVAEIDHMKETENFQKLKSFATVSQQLAERKASLKNWPQDSKLFDELGASDNVKDKVYRYLRDHPETDLTYQDLLLKLKK